MYGRSTPTANRTRRTAAPVVDIESQKIRTKSQKSRTKSNTKSKTESRNLQKSCKTAYAAAGFCCTGQYLLIMPYWNTRYPGKKSQSRLCRSPCVARAILPCYMTTRLKDDLQMLACGMHQQYLYLSTAVPWVPRSVTRILRGS
eukprot:SAG11_NODE_6762_length_1252_cov_1.447528_1_plen_144_part_00